MAPIRHFISRQLGNLRPLGSGRGAALLLLAVCIVTAPLAWGGVLSGGTFRIELLAFAVLLVTALTHPLEFRPLRIPCAAILGVVAIGLFQLIPFGPSIVHALSPTSAALYAHATEILKLYGRTSAPAVRISLAPTETASAILLTLAYLALLVSSFVLLRTRGSRRFMAAVLCATGVLQTIIALTTNDGAERAHGSFVNPNHLAAYLEIALAMSFGLIWAAILTRHDRGAGARDRAARLEREYIPIIPLILLWGFIAGGIAMSRSRGGVASAVITTIILIVLAALGRARRPATSRRLVLPVAIGSLIAGIVFVVGATGATAITRFASSDSTEIGSDLRFEIWSLSLKAWREFPLFGSGLGAFREGFRLIQPAGFKGLLEYAHNDFLQLLVSGGALGALFGSAAMLSVLLLLLRHWREQRHREESALALAAVGALLSLIIHGFVDFNLSIPGIAATLAVVSGAGLAAATRSEEKATRRRSAE